MPTWMPSFLNVSPAMMAAAIFIPTLFALYFLKLRRREMPISSTILWRKAIEDLQVNAPFQKLRRNLLLLIQLLLLLLLIAALARPVSNMFRQAGNLSVLLIDRSASMAARDVDGRSRLEEAKRRANELVESMPRGASAMVVAFDDRAETVQAFTGDRAALHSAIESITQTDRPTRLKLAYQLAEAQMGSQAQEGARPQIWVLSDGRVLDGETLRATADVRFDPIGNADSKNIAIVALSARRNFERPTEVEVFARLANFGTEAAATDVQFSLAEIDPTRPNDEPQWNVARIGSTFLHPDRWDDKTRAEYEQKTGNAHRDFVSFKIDLTTAALLRIEQLNTQGDVLVSDDSAQIVVPAPRQLKAALVTEGNFFLEKVFRSLNLKEPAVLSPGAYEASFSSTDNSPSSYDVIIFDRYKPSRIPSAGNFLWFAAVPSGIELSVAQENGNDQLLGQQGVLDWERDHPLLRHLVLGRLVMAQSLKLVPGLQSEVLMEGTRGPLMILHRQGAQTHLVCAFDVLQSDWPLRVSFPIFMSNAMQFLALGTEMDVRESVQPGSTPRIPMANLERAGVKDRLALIGPDGQREVQMTGGIELALPALDRVGVYALQPAVPRFERIAVNLLDPNESNLAPAEKAPGNVGQVLQRGSEQSRVELWWWIIAAGVIPFLLIEWWVFARRVHL